MRKTLGGIKVFDLNAIKKNYVFNYFLKKGFIFEKITNNDHQINKIILKNLYCFIRIH